MGLLDDLRRIFADAEVSLVGGRDERLEAERALVQVGEAPETAWTREDGDGDGRTEVYVRTRALSVTLEPDAGGMVTELGYYPAGLDVADVLARRPEAYHDKVRERAAAGASGGARTIHEAATPKETGLDALLSYDELRRGSLIEAFFADGGEHPGLPDGSTVDADGCLWNARWGGGSVIRYAPNGKADRVVRVAAANPTCVAFGGDALSTLYITTARIGRTAAQLAEEQHAGAVFAVEPGVGGLVEPRYAG